MKLKQYMLLLIFFLAHNCSNSVGNDVITKEGIVIWEGSYAVDGCGFSIEIEDKIYKPENEEIISVDFTISHRTQAIIRFEYLHKELEYSCGFSGPQLREGIKLIAVSKI
ncbi:MAG: hypothetical protein D8M58_21240 [Calditrichaeota bacterium]|nr:MAG: hypothetical protein DWQ03_16955 [Calditrichota bacterium]MBL1207938.1 hypothetical protein [Calditrichota bacterium]NOG47773.1 hypothetical protein [Calditrichota bacterium]